VNVDADRNYLRAEVVPRLLQRWPGALRTGGRSASLLRAMNAQVDAMAQRDLARVTDGHALNLPLLRRIAPTRVSEVLRAWFVREGAPLPDQARMAEIVTVLHLRDDAQPAVRWSGVELRRHRDRLMVAKTAAPRARPAPPLAWQWPVHASLQVSGGCLHIVADPHGEVDLSRLPRPLFVSGRPSGRDMQAGGGSIDIKSLLRESDVPSWRRSDLPFLYATGGDSTVTGLLAIADLWLAPRLRATPDSRRRGRIVWRES
jgi:tRNA(Ile)-lysidine synthase